MSGRKIVLCVSGSISAYKSVTMLRSLRKLGAFVSVAVTPSVQNFVGSATFSALASEPVYNDLFDNRGSIAHTTLGRGADLVLVAPASSNTISKMANGVCNDIVSAILLATPKSTPVLIAPAMHEEMYENFATQNNISKLTDNGYHFVGPETGELAGGDIGTGRLIDEEIIVGRVVELLKGKPYTFQGRTLESGERSGFVDASVPPVILRAVEGSKKRPKLIVTAGGTREPIDPVRVITNRSSGKMGIAIANAGLASGYEVILITTSPIETVEGIFRVNVETADQMHDAVMSYLPDADVVIMAAAVGDVKPKNYSSTKLKREVGIGNIELVDNVDIALQLQKNKNEKTKLVCFSAETNDVLENAKKKALKKQPDVMIANDVSRDDSGFNKETNKIWIGLKPEYEFEEYATLTKEEAAFAIIEAI